MPTFSLAPDARAALDQIREASDHAVVMVFKKSPTCPISHEAEAEWRRFLRTVPEPTLVAEIDVIAERALARGLVAELGIRHESPQVLVFARQDLTWHESHGEITEGSLRGHRDQAAHRLASTT